MVCFCSEMFVTIENIKCWEVFLCISTEEDYPESYKTKMPGMSSVDTKWFRLCGTADDHF